MKLISNEQIANALTEIANILEEYEENPYRIRAYRRAANSVKKHSSSIHELFLNEIDITTIHFVGERISKVIQQMLITGNLNIIPAITPAIPIPLRLLNRKRKSVYKIYSLIHIIEKIIERLKNYPEIKSIECTGDYRRKKELVSDFDILIVTDHSDKIFKEFHTFPSVKYIVETTNDYTIVQLKLGIRITLRIVHEQLFGASLLYYTGVNSHWENLKVLAKSKGFNLSEKGLYQKRKAIASFSEGLIYQKLDLEFIEPELRENRGEIEASLKNNLPKLIELNNIKGDLHCHTNETDGTVSLEEMVIAACKQGYQYVAITDHSKSLKITNGLDEKRVLKQIELINALNAKLKNFTILKSIEVDILEDGSLDLPDYILKELDLRVCSVHSKFRLSMEKQTERIIRAMDNPYFNILGHATGRLLKYRQPYELDMDRILLAAKERNCFLEINAQPARLDINDLYCKKAKEIGVKMAISSDAHATNGFHFMILGVNQARRGWLEAGDVINTFNLSDLIKILKR